MKKYIVVGALAGALMVPVAADAAPATYKVTGGGQVFAGTDPAAPVPQGPGDTIAFQAFSNGTVSDATGQVNIVDRTPGAGGKGAHYKGSITCAYIAHATEDAPAYAELRGIGSVKGEGQTLFRVRIQDDGQGADTLDLVEFSRNFDDGDDNTSDAEEAEGCSEETADDAFSTSLARGNAKIHKAKSNGSRSSQKASWTKSLRLAGLR